ncbi:Possible membrane associated protease [Prochlorococcus marinus str. MIT 9211]|uniref:Possible membrane associated protease n=2 Tax=Prochlorococcus marinus TaxID=1219 RepID=A9BED9_PROM4|nr:Possible membrane associated protease [Prochlorococcus marinus str. MIT 9211]
MRQQGTPQWKVLLAVFSVLLTAFIWQKGLEESFDRPSVAPMLSLKQHEMALLASPAMPKPLRPIFVGSNPEKELEEIIREIPPENRKERENLLLTLVDQSDEKSNSLNEIAFTESNWNLAKEILLESRNKNRNIKAITNELEFLKEDPLMYRLSCLAIASSREVCVEETVSQRMAFRLVASQLLPSLATFFGIGLCLRQGWLFYRRESSSWPENFSLPLSAIDMVLLVAGGFVVLGEVITPLFAIPASQLLTESIHSPTKESLTVFVGYSAMTLPSLVIFRQQLRMLKGMEPPIRGWMQWGIKPVNKGVMQALQGWLMVMPFVLLTSWLVGFFLEDPGGSNPLLEMVLSSKNYWALSILFLTTVVLAPLFEEFIFRGALLPVLVKSQGRAFGVILSALVFALAHLSIGELPPLLVLGIGLALLRISTGRLFPCVIMHSLWNGVTFASLLLLGG